MSISGCPGGSAAVWLVFEGAVADVAAGPEDGSWDGLQPESHRAAVIIKQIEIWMEKFIMPPASSQDRHQVKYGMDHNSGARREHAMHGATTDIRPV
jgi:hypothetical protein